ncbi:SDR family NAD(P)-dependent oxidoreductase [Desulfogranum mediterraneum]|uniref:SDR family NAD(P)-dependent oxidoreductase n=1 Tax=Desulfogranum mediterraneum TaxID=160661 RepID=UPI0004253E78|nr:SDR family NAD(P)-dependent oxidoreductase [Desulfogranum mediterraneum]
MRILITGATSGIGRALSLDYHRQGHELWAVGRNRAALAELESRGIHVCRLDLRQREESLAWFSRLHDQGLGLDLAILNAGTCEYLDLPVFDSALVSRVMRANLDSMAVSIEGVLPLLRRGTRPQLVGVGSSAAYLPLPRAEAYGASKAAVAYLLESLRLDLYREGIAVSLVCPGFVQTPLTDRNDFPMPCRVSTARASRIIRRGIGRRQAEIHFPWRFTLLLKLGALLPGGWWCRLAQRMIS